MRSIIIALLLCVCINASGQIQTKFWGLELSKFYSSLDVAQRIISERCAYADIDGNSISATRCSFGGYDWNFANFSFYQGSILSKALYNVEFSSYHQTLDSAKIKYDNLASSLTNKYGKTFNTSNDYENRHYFWTEDNSPYSCYLRLTRAESKGGEIYWYVILSYCDHDLLDLNIQQREDEL